MTVTGASTDHNMKTRTGAAVIPFARWQDSTRFLFHKTFSGRRAGLLVDFGGGSRSGESYAQTAAREFIEETDAMFFAENCKQDLGLLFESQYLEMLRLIGQTQQLHPRWFCRRMKYNSGKTKDWITYFTEVEYRDPTEINRAWAGDTTGRFRKRRELLWLASDQLIDIIDNSPGKLWKRIREYKGMRDVVQAIAKC